MKRIALLLVATSFTLPFQPQDSYGQDFPSTGAGGFGSAIQIPEAAANALPSLSGADGLIAPPTSTRGIAPANVPQQLFGQSYGEVFGAPNQFSTNGVRGYQTVVESAPRTAPRNHQTTIQSVQPAVQTNQPASQIIEVAPAPYQVENQFVESVDSSAQGTYSPSIATQCSSADEVVFDQGLEPMGCQSCGCSDGSCDDFVFEDHGFPVEQVQPNRRQRRRARRACSGGCDSCSDCVTCSGSVRTPRRALRQTRRIVGQRSGGGVYSTAGASALLLSRNLGNNVDFATNGGDLLSSNNADHDILPGIDAFIGRRRASGRGWEARYFGLYPTDQSIQIGNNAQSLLPGLNQLSTSVAANAPGNVFLTGPTAASIFGLGDTHVLTRQTELNNVEINLLKNSTPRLRALSTEFLFGIRYFQFGETLLYEAVDLQGGDPMFARPESAAFLSSVENNLLGFQIGARSDYQLRDRLMIHVGGKIGAYNNSINTRQRVDYRMNNGSVINPFVEGSGQRFDVGAEEEVKSILGELDVAVSYQLSNAARVRAGYRALGITDIAFASDQIQDDFTDTAGLVNPNTNNEFVLQGAYVGLEFAY